MLAFIDYLNLNYESAIYKFDRIIKLYPSHKNIDYAYYMRAMCYFEQIENEELDGLYNELSLENFKEITNRFPNSEYAQDSRQKILFILENIAAKHMNIGMFYLKQKKYLAAIKRFNNVINNHSKSKFTPEALYRLVEIYLTLGLVDDAEKSASVIAYNYPKSIWYEKSYALFYPEQKKTKSLNFFKGIKNIFKNKDNVSKE